MPVYVVVVGPQASGKSTIAAALGAALREQGEQVAVVELDAIAAMALPTLPSWDTAHEIFETVTGLWARAGQTWVIAEGSGSRAEAARLLQQAPLDAMTLTVAVTTDFPTACTRAQADPTRGLSKDRDFLRDVYQRWTEELRHLGPDVVLDTSRLDVGGCVTRVVQEAARRRSSA